jgi:chemotaxis protein CheZ
MPDGAAGAGGPDTIERVVREVLGTLSGDLTVTEAALLSELEALGREVARAKSEIAALQVDDITASHIPAATDELDAVVAHTASATNEILDACEVLEGLQPNLSEEAANAVSGAVTRIYEACSFQDITGQRISKVVNALKSIERRVASVIGAFGRNGAAALPEEPQGTNPRTEGQQLANGPQLPANAASQREVDALLASFD